MDARLFDRRAQVLGRMMQRRGALAVLAGMLVAGGSLGRMAGVPAAKKGKKGKSRKKRCKRGQARCGKRCFDTKTSKAHCGSCGNRCEGELTCLEGGCGCAGNVCRVALFETDFWPSEIAVSSTGDIIVADVLDDLPIVFNARGAFVRQIGEFGTDPGEFQYPTGIAIDASGNIYVADSSNHRIQRLGSNGSVEVWPVDGYPEGVAVTSGGVVYAVAGDQVIRFKPSGEVDYAWGPDGESDANFDWSVGIAADAEGHVFVVDESANLVYGFSDGGAANIQQDWVVGGLGADPGEFRDPEDVAVSNGFVFVTDNSNSRVQALDAADGSFLFEWESETPWGDLWYPAGITSAPDGRIYVTDTNSIFVFELGNA